MERSTENLKAELAENLDILAGSVVTRRAKCGKNCVCNNGEGHITHYLSSKKDGKTRNLYLPPGAVEEAIKMTLRHKAVKRLLLQIAEGNYETLKSRHLTKGK